MHFRSDAEDSHESGWAEVVVQGTIPKKQVYYADFFVFASWFSQGLLVCSNGHRL